MKSKKNIMNTIKTEEEQDFIERVWEKFLWSTRYIVILAVLFSILAAITLFIVGSYEIVYTVVADNPLLFSDSKSLDHKKMLYTLIGAVDLYLIGIVLLIFGFGIYELFISPIDIARKDAAVTILEVENLDELKNKIIKVIIMVLIVSFFERILKISSTFSEPKQMFYFAGSILALSLGVYFVRKK
tara:strand:- start:226 stop:783 length:558 start_codon:yes stop_codon:yes gene_type:complete